MPRRRHYLAARRHRLYADRFSWPRRTWQSVGVGAFGRAGILAQRAPPFAKRSERTLSALVGPARRYYRILLGARCNELMGRRIRLRVGRPRLAARFPNAA